MPEMELDAAFPRPAKRPYSAIETSGSGNAPGPMTSNALDAMENGLRETPAMWVRSTSRAEAEVSAPVLQLEAMFHLHKIKDHNHLAGV